MKKGSQNIKTIINFVEVNGIGTISLTDGTLRDVLVYGYFKKWHWYFIVNQDTYYEDCVVVSEASTGRILTDYCYPDVESALRSVLPYIEEKHYYFSTTVGNILVKTKCNLCKRNTTNLQTLAIDSLLWNT